VLSLQASGFSAPELDRFRDYQRRSYAALEAVAAGLTPGDTEREVARRIHRALRAAGAQAYFHVPVALFGDRTSYPGDFGQLGALPTDRRLAPADPVILDAAPIFDGYTVDTSLALQLGGAPVPPRLDRALAELRAEICAQANAGANMRAVARAVDAAITARGLVNCHKKHIGFVLGHRVTKETRPYLRGRAVWGLAPRQVAWFLARTAAAARGRPTQTPNWNHTRQCDCPPQDGLWAIEPHVAEGGVGAKFEDILVIDRGRAYYLDDDLPHTRRWRAAGLA
jgi:Xaa-Pro aminopeptidase